MQEYDLWKLQGKKVKSKDRLIHNYLQTVETGEMQAIFQRRHPGHLLSRESDKTRERRVKRAKRRPKNRQNNRKI